MLQVGKYAMPVVLVPAFPPTIDAHLAYEMVCFYFLWTGVKPDKTSISNVN